MEYNIDNPRLHQQDREYRNLHNWVKRKLGKANKCVICFTLTAKKYDWSNISGKYKKRVSDWEMLCRSCHHINDDVSGKRNKTMKLKNIPVTNQYTKLQAHSIG